MVIRVGVCGFTKKYYNFFKVVELQRTFYNIPRMQTVQKWRQEAPPEFEFAFKVFQGLTHSKSSPTWRRFTGKLKDEEMNLVGDLRINDVTLRFMKTMIDIAKTLNSPIIIVQTPARFKYNKENFDRAVEFFQRFEEVLKKEGFSTYIGWEPRGNWLENISAIKKILETTDLLIHVVDPLFQSLAQIRELSYFRLHGKPYLNYKYQYSDTDFEQIYKAIKDTLDAGSNKVYVMFNNVKMVDDASRFEQFLKSRGL